MRAPHDSRADRIGVRTGDASWTGDTPWITTATRRYIRGILNTVKTIAMVGVSPKDNRPSYFAFKYLLERGYRMIPVNPGPGRQGPARTEGLRAGSPTSPSRSTWSTSSARSQYALGIVEEALALKPRPQVIWMQLGVRNDEAAQARRSRRHQGRDEPLPEDRIRPAVVGDRLDGRQLAHPLGQERSHLPAGLQRMSLNRTTLAGGATDAAQRATQSKAILIAADRPGRDDSAIRTSEDTNFRSRPHTMASHPQPSYSLRLLDPTWPVR